MIGAFSLALVRLFDPRLLPIWLKSLAVTVLACAALGGAGWWVLGAAIDHYTGPNGLGGVAAALAVVLALWLTVPLANFAAPFLGAACAVHLIHRKSLR